MNLMSATQAILKQNYLYFANFLKGGDVSSNHCINVFVFDMMYLFRIFVFLEVLSGVPNSLLESILIRLPLKRLSKHNLRAAIMLLPLLAADLEALFCSVFVVVVLQQVEVVLMSFHML
jgi:hypothetical protein